MTTSVARLWYGLTVRLCVFDLDHTLVRTPLDLAAMALDMRALPRAALRPAARPARALSRRRAARTGARPTRRTLETPLWEIALDHERRAMADRHARARRPRGRRGRAGGGLRDRGVDQQRPRGHRPSRWSASGWPPVLDLVVTRDEMRALKPDPDGWRVIAEHFGRAAERRRGGRRLLGGRRGRQAAGVPFIAYRAERGRPRRAGRSTPVARLDDLAALPAWLRQRADGELRRASVRMELFEQPAERGGRPRRPGRSPTACGRARSTRSSARSTCSARARCCARRSRAASCTR